MVKQHIKLKTWLGQDGYNFSTPKGVEALTQELMIRKMLSAFLDWLGERQVRKGDSKSFAEAAWLQYMEASSSEKSDLIYKFLEESFEV